MAQQVQATQQKEVVELDVQLSQEEFNVKALEYAQMQGRIDEVEEKRKQVNSRYKDHIGGLRSRSNTLRRVVTDRKEKRDVPCTWYADWGSNSMLLRRDDTQEVVRARTMTSDELQVGIDYERADTAPPEDEGTAEVLPKGRRLPKGAVITPRADRDDHELDG